MEEIDVGEESMYCNPFDTVNVLSLQWIRTTMFCQSVKDLN